MTAVTVPAKVACNSPEPVPCGVRKRWNCNEGISMCERLIGELHAKLLIASAVQTCCSAHVGPMTCAWAAPPRCMSTDLRANNTPCPTLLCPKRSPPRPQRPVFSIFHRGGLHFGHHTPSSRGLTASKRGNCDIRDPTRRRHADSQLLMLQNPHRRFGERRSDLMGLAAVPVGGGGARPNVSTQGPTGVEGAGGTGGHGRASRSTTPSEARVWRSRGRPGPTAPGTPAGP